MRVSMLIRIALSAAILAVPGAVSAQFYYVGSACGPADGAVTSWGRGTGMISNSDTADDMIVMCPAIKDDAVSRYYCWHATVQNPDAGQSVTCRLSGRSSSSYYQGTADSSSGTSVQVLSASNYFYSYEALVLQCTLPDAVSALSVPSVRLYDVLEGSCPI